MPWASSPSTRERRSDSPGTGMGLLDPFHGYVVYRRLDPREPDQLEEVGSGLDIGRRDLDSDVVQHG